MSREPPDRCQSGYSSFRQVRGSAGWAFGVRSSKALKYGATTDREGNSESVQSRATVGTQSLQLVTKLYADETATWPVARMQSARCGQSRRKTAGPTAMTTSPARSACRQRLLTLSRLPQAFNLSSSEVAKLSSESGQRRVPKPLPHPLSVLPAGEDQVVVRPAGGSVGVGAPPSFVLYNQQALVGQPVEGRHDGRIRELRRQRLNRAHHEGLGEPAGPYRRHDSRLERSEQTE